MEVYPKFLMNNNSDFLIEKLLIQKNCWIRKSQCISLLGLIKLSKLIQNWNLFFSIGKIIGIKFASKRASFSLLGGEVYVQEGNEVKKRRSPT